MANEQMEQLLTDTRKALFESNLSVPEMRAAFDGGAPSLAGDVTVVAVDANGVPAEWVSAPNAGDTVVLYFHGGGYVIGSPTSHRDLASRIARAAAARALLLDYRLAPEHPFPAAVDDAVAAYRFLLAQGIPPSKIVFAGDSAGGGLTLAALVAVRDAGLPLPAAGVGLSSWTDLAVTGESVTSRAGSEPLIPTEILYMMARTYLAGADARHPLASPLYADLRGLPPLLLQVGTREILYDDTARVAEQARAAGVDCTLEAYEDMPHVHQLFAAIEPEGQRAIDRIGAFVRAHATAAPAAR